MKSRFIGIIYTARARLLLILLLGIQLEKTAAQVSTTIDPGITTEVNGGITVESDGNWLNQGTMLPGNSTLALQGSYTQLIQQDGGAFFNVTINKNGGDVILSGNIHINAGTLTIVNQDLSLNGFLITLDPAASLNETAGNTVKGPNGYITTTRMLSSPSNNNVAGMGLVLTSNQNFGITEIRRGHGIQSANGVESIQRYFDVMPQFDSNLNATLRFIYDESELNGQDETALKMYRSPDEGLNWEEVPGVVNATDNYFEAVGVNTLSRFTLSSYCMETCIATQANVQPAIVYLNSAGLAYLTPEAVNNGSKGACGIDTMFVSPDVFDCDDVGTQPVTLTVRDNHGCEKATVVNIEVRDSIDPNVHCKNILLQLHQSCQETITPDDIDDGSYDVCGVSLSINVSSFDCSNGGPNDVVLTATDPSGNSASCSALVKVVLPVSVICHDTTLNIGALSSTTINPFDVLQGSPNMYEGFSFVVSPATLSCNQLGANSVTITGTDPFGEESVCQTTVYLEGPDADCDGVSDACDLCDGGDDQLDTDGDGIPNCADWDGWQNLLPPWQCAANKALVCHLGHVICVNQNAVPAHLGHGDFLGPCDAASCPLSLIQLTSTEPIVDQYETDEHLDVDKNDYSFSEHAVNPILENHPNPFYKETWIRMYIPVSNEITLSVFDMMGQPILILAKGYYEKGWHEFRFDGDAYPAGIYYYRLESNGQRITRSMVMMNN